MNRIGAVVRLAEGLQADDTAFRSLRELLEAQFHAALRHQSAELTGLSGRITALCEEIETRRKERVALVDLLEPGQEGVEQRIRRMLSRLPEPHARAALSAWRALEELVLECKSLNVRNCKLMMDQFDIMQRVLATGDETYAPA